MDQSNDYSYAAQPSLASQTKIAAYIDGSLVWGTEPGATAITASLRASRRGGIEPLALHIGPNPAHGHAVALMDLPTEGRVRLRVSNLAGERVQDLDLGECRAGTLSAPLNLQRLAPGVYLVQLDLSAQGPGSGRVWFKLAVK